jgi:hypothetical protein
MTLQDFVRDSLLQITAGVGEARKQNERISPFVCADNKSGGTFHTLDRSVAFMVEFDVAVTVAEKKDGSGKAGISVAHIFSAEGGGGLTAEQSRVSRIQFRVPVVYATMTDAGQHLSSPRGQ